MNPEILTLGEPLVEFNSASEGDLDNNTTFHQGFGGDTSNFAVSAARSGGSVGYMTAVGADPFGEALLQMWKNENIETGSIKQMEQFTTGIYFISRISGKHKFTYYRKGSAASRMTPEILPIDTIKNAKLLHMSGITQAISSSACQTNDRALAIAKESKTLVSYDPNLRTMLWDLEQARDIIHGTVPKTDILLPSYDDAVLLTGLKKPEDISDYYLNMGAKIVVLKMGKEGVLLAQGKTIKHFSPYPVKQIDASGAGDTFCGAFIAEYVNNSSIGNCIRYAGTAAALSTTGIGCVNSIPKRAEVLSALEKVNQ